MKFLEKNPPRKFIQGAKQDIEILDVGKVEMNDNENVSILCNGKEHEVTKKDWGFYATQSVNSRLKNAGFKTALVRNELDRYYIMMVDTDKMDEFHKYLEDEKNYVEEWLDER
jgi:hypothetical protein